MGPEATGAKLREALSVTIIESLTVEMEISRFSGPFKDQFTRSRFYIVSRHLHAQSKARVRASGLFCLYVLARNFSVTRASGKRSLDSLSGSFENSATPAQLLLAGQIFRIGLLF